MNLNVIGNWIGKRFGVSLPSFAEPIGKALQWLFSASKATNIVKDDGYTYVKDAANSGTDRLSKRGFARNYDGINGVTTIPHSADLTFGNGTTDQPFSISAWVNLTDATAFAVLNQKNGALHQYDIQFSNLDSLAFICWTDGSNYLRSLTTETFTAYEGQDLFVTATYDGTGNASGLNLRVFQTDGTEISLTQTKAEIGTYTGLSGNSDDCYIGLRGTANYGNGNAWDVRVHNTELTTTEIDNMVTNPTYLTGHEVGIWHLDEEAGTTAFDSIGGNHGTDTGGVTHVNQDTLSFPNKYGYSENVSYSGVTIPAKLDTIPPTLDVLGNALTHSGQAPKDGRLVESHCVTLDGVGDEIVLDSALTLEGAADWTFEGWFNITTTGNARLLGATGATEYILTEITAGVVKLRAAAGLTLTLDTGGLLLADTWTNIRIEHDADTTVRLYINDILTDTDVYVTDIVVDQIGHGGAQFTEVKIAGLVVTQEAVTAIHYPLAEGAGLVAYDISGNENHGTIVGTEGAIWANTQDLYHHNILNGFNLVGSVKDPTSTTSNPSGKWHNGAETKVNTNYLPDPELTYRGGIPLDNLIHPNDTFTSPEFMNDLDADQAKDYVVYDKNISAEQETQIQNAIGI